MKALRNRFRDDRGMTLVFVGLGMVAFMSATMLAVDVGNLMVARTQSQTAADSGALAAVTALVFDDWNNRTSTGPAVQNGIAAATAASNKVMSKPVSVLPGDVTFPAVDKAMVTVYRTTARGNPVSTFLGSMMGISTVDVGATATAQASPANAATCVKPFLIPDRWTEKQDPTWDPMKSTFDMYDNKGNLLPNPDKYVPADQPGYTGYSMTRDKGMELQLRAGTGNNIEPSSYYSWKMPSDTGGDYYRDNISGCNTSIVHWNDVVIQEPGDMSGPTNQGIDDLIAKDPNAVWDTSCNCVKNSAYGSASPRVAPIPLYDPVYYAQGKAGGRNASFKVANWIGFFIEYRSGNNVFGRITPILGVIDPNAGPAPAGAIPQSIRLVQ